MKEENVQVRVAQYLATNYPSVQFHSDFGSGCKLTKGQAIKQKRQNAGRRGWPDMFIAQPMFNKKDNIYNGFFGMFLELKKEGTRIYKKDGSFASPHIEEQARMLDALTRKGYYTQFGIGFEDCKKKIDDYLGGSNVKDDDCIF